MQIIMLLDNQLLLLQLFHAENKAKNNYLGKNDHLAKTDS